MQVQFVKMHGSSNDFILVDEWDDEVIPEVKKPDFVVAASNRHRGIGSEGVIFVQKSSRYDARFLFFNPDGQVAEMSGNGLLCFAKYVYESGHVEKTLMSVETSAGMKTVGVTLFNDRVEQTRLDMGEPQLTRGEIGVSGNPKDTFINQAVQVDGGTYVVTSVGTGNPHAVLFVEDIEAAHVVELGSHIRNMKELFPHGVNVHFVEKSEKNRFSIRSFERGVEDETLACGSGVCASAVAAVLTARADPHRAFVFDTRGGELNVELVMDGDRILQVFLVGPAIEVFRGGFEYNPSEKFERAAYGFISDALKER
jgi:diaminopimelate epimerase